MLHDGDVVELGGARLVAHKTAGHTKGCTTWTMRVRAVAGGPLRDAVIVGSTSVLSEYRLVGRESYPGIAADYEHTFAVLKALPCDLFLGSHGSFYGMERKYREQKGGTAEAFVDPVGYRAFVAGAETAFREVLLKQRNDKSGAS